MHLTTFDGLHYDFQAVGEFTFAKATDGSSFDIQIRLQPWSVGANVSVITAAAFEIGTDRVTFQHDRPDLIYLDGVAVTVNLGHPLLLAGGAIYNTGGGNYEIAWKTGQVAQLSTGGSYMNLEVYLGTGSHNGGVDGLLGPNTGNAANDLQLPDGTVLSQPIGSATFYGEYANAWRVTDSSTLFDYAAGQTTASFTDTNFPAYSVSLSDLPASVISQIQALAAAAGIDSSALQESAILDFLATGDPSFFTADANAEQNGDTPTSTLQVTNTTPPPVQVGITAQAQSVKTATTGDTTVTFQVYRTSSTGDLTLDFSVINAGSNSVTASSFGGLLPTGAVTILDGQTTATFTVDLTGGIGSAAAETLEVQLQDQSGVTFLGSTAQTQIINGQPTAGPAAVPIFVGANSQNGNNWSINLGAIQQGTTVNALSLGVANAGGYLADLLSGALSASGTGFNVTLGSAFSNLVGAGYLSNISVAVDTSKLGQHTETITFTSTDSNPDRL